MNLKSFDFKKHMPLLLDAAVVLFFVLIVFVYFYPAFEGKRIGGHDNSANDGLKVELDAYRQQHNGETPRWINSIFSGMPTYQIAPSYDAEKPMSFIENASHLWLPDYAWYVFMSLFGFYILLRVFDFKWWMSGLGAIIWAFSSYFFIIIAAGHGYKAMCLAYIPPTIAGMVMCYKGRYLWGFIVTTLFASFQLHANHIQMSYYFLIPEILMFGAFLVKCIVKKQYLHLGKATVAIVLAAVVAVGLNSSNLYHTYEYSKHARTSSELNTNEEDKTDGLDRSYITGWSYGIGETWSLMIPNVKGGSSDHVLAESKAAMKHKDKQLAQAGLYKGSPQYFGEQPFTAGPVYVGALVCMLFVLSLFTIPNRNPMKWVLLVSTILSIMLAWGSNFQGLTDLFIDYMPMYSKFRTVSSILVVAEFTIPLMAIIGLKYFFDYLKDAKKKDFVFTSLTFSAGITLFICLMFALFPSIAGEGYSTRELEAYTSQYPDQSGMILGALSKARLAIVSADAWRSFLFIFLGTGALFFAYFMFLKPKKQFVFNIVTISVTCVLILICLGDMWSVNKRYMNDGKFAKVVKTKVAEKTDIDQYILDQSGDKRDYRVLNLAVNTFNDNTTSFYFNSIGGYHPAKLTRYQDLIENSMTKELQSSSDEGRPVLNMLNTRWFIVPNEGEVAPMENTGAYGNVWFVDDVKVVDSAKDEYEGLYKWSPRHNAIVSKEYAAMLGKDVQPADSTDKIKLTAQTSTTAEYVAETKKGGVAVFSEIYYPDWECTIDGKPVEIARANYVLRAVKVPAGKHVIKMTFEPKSIQTTATITYVCLAIFFLALALAIFLGVRKWMKDKNAPVDVVKQ